MNSRNGERREERFQDHFMLEEQYGGAKHRVKKSKSGKKYARSENKYTDKCGVVRTIYLKDGVKYIRKKSAKTGKYGYYKLRSKSSMM